MNLNHNDYMKFIDKLLNDVCYGKTKTNQIKKIDSKNYLITNNELDVTVEIKLQQYTNLMQIVKKFKSIDFVLNIIICYNLEEETFECYYVKNGKINRIRKKMNYETSHTFVVTCINLENKYN